jgi:hypothetical protein
MHELPRRDIPGNPPSPGPIGPGPTGPYPLHRTGYERYSPSFREQVFSETHIQYTGQPRWWVLVPKHIGVDG